MACGRSLTWSLANTFETWLRTVLSARCNRRAISRLLHPSAISCRISISRSVSSGNGRAARLPAGAVAKKASARAATPAPKTTSPAATASMARTISSRSAPLTRYPRAPARIAVNNDSSLSNIVSTRTAVPGLRAAIWRVASMPPVPGMCRSISTTSTPGSQAAVTAAVPSLASPTTLMLAASARAARRPCRNSGWSSAISTLMVITTPRAESPRRPACPGHAPPPRCTRRRARRRARPLTGGRAPWPDPAAACRSRRRSRSGRGGRRSR
jgi:hypothetical protein